ncbi:MAG: MFS transporter [Acidobacteriota bacterium]|nr:MFS transporter [Acidobacteriota bacterium]
MTTQSPAVPQSESEHAENPYPAVGYAWYVVGVLTLVYVFSFIDRQILNLLVKPIRRDLAITDFQMGLLMGPAFAVFYTLFGIPLGRLADSKSRRAIIAIGFVVWSFFTAMCGVAKNFWHMAAARVGVGVGEGALSPAAYSIIADYFTPQRRATAISVYSMGIYIGSGVANILGATAIAFFMTRPYWDLPVVGAVRGWQVVFFVVGLPGVLLALLMYTVREPIRRGMKKIQDAEGKLQNAQVSLDEVIAYLKLNWKTFACHNVGFALLSFSSYGTSGWVPTMFVRTFGWTEAKIGFWYGAIVAIFGALGIAAGGWYADWLAKRGAKDAVMKVGFIVSLAWAPTGMLYPVMPNPYWALALLIPTAFFTAAPFGVAPAAIQQIMPNAMRAQASSIYLFVVNLIGLGGGPLAVSFFTQYVFRDDSAVRYSILIVSTIAHIISAVLLWVGIKQFNLSLERLKVWHG